jgi:hypothetical protein
MEGWAVRPGQTLHPHQAEQMRARPLKEAVYEQMRGNMEPFTEGG